MALINSSFASYLTLTNILLVGLSALPFYILTKVIYNLAFHPLRQFPGPLSHRATVLPYVSSLMSGRMPYHIADLHSVYGEVVRVAPDQLAFTDSRAWDDIYARHGQGRYEIPQDEAFYNAQKIRHCSMIGLRREEHDAQRKIMASGFSDKAMKAQEPVIGGYVDLLIKRLKEASVGDDGVVKAVNMRDWYAFTTFDVIGKLAFGSDFGCLDSSTYHPWVNLIAGNVKDLAVLACLRTLGIEKQLAWLMTKLGVGGEKRRIHVELTTERMKQRLEMGTGHDDFMDSIVKTDMSFDQMTRNAGLFIVAGSETTATLLAGVTFLLTTHPEVMGKLEAEVRGRFNDESEITLTSVNSLTYMLAVLNEALRIYPPSPNNAPRRVGPGGTTVAGYFIPEGNVVGIYLWSMFHSPHLFTDPNKFDPERWLDRSEKSRYAGDRLDAVKPFLTGPRNCLGQNLAIAEMRLILARVVWNFDMAINEGCQGWLENQKSYLLWDKPVLDVHLMPVR